MKKTVIIIAAIIIFCVIANRISQPPSNTVPVKIEDKTYNVLTAKNDAEWTKGLMYVRKLDNADGMVFLFPDKQPRTFWNENTLIDLDIIWMDGDRVIGRSFLPSIEKSKGIVMVTSPGLSDKVVELLRK